MIKKATDSVINRPIACWIMAILGILMGIFFIVSQNSNTPIARDEAISYSGSFDHYDTAWKNYREIHFADGSVYDVYPHTETETFRSRMKALPKGTQLHILVNPNNQYVVEIRTDSTELLNFEQSQQDIAAYDDGYVFIGIIACIGGVFLILYTIGSSNYKRKEDSRHAEQSPRTVPLRRADQTAKCRILLETTVNGYCISYRRIKHVNELVINGQVYDEKKGIIEFAHKLLGVVDGHTVEAGFDEDDYSYISFDDERIKEKKRLL